MINSPLSQRVVCTVEDILGLAHCIDLACASFLTCLVILEEPIAICVQIAQSLVSVHQISLLVLQCFLVIHQPFFSIGQSCFLVCHGLGIFRSLLRTVLHEFLIVTLGILLLQF